MSVVFRKIYVDGGVSRDSGDGTRSVPSEMSFVASQIFPVPGRTRASEESGGRMAGRYVRLPGVKGGEPEARSEQIMCEVASAAQRGNYLKEANFLGCRRPRRSPKVNPAGLTNRNQNTVPVWSLEIRSDSWSYHQTAVRPWNNGSASLCLLGK